MSIVFTALRKILFGSVMKAAISFILTNEALQRKVFFWLAQKIVDQTDTPADNELLAIVEQALGEKPDLSELKKLGG